MVREKRQKDQYSRAATAQRRRLELEKYNKRWDVIQAVFLNIIKYGCGLWALYMVTETVTSVADAANPNNVLVKILFDLDMERLACILLAGGTSVGYVRERRLRKKTIARFAPFVKKLEEQSDPDRSSSNLTESGDTHPEDEI